MADPISAAVIGAGAAIIVGGATVAVTGVGATAAAIDLGRKIHREHKDKKAKQGQPQQALVPAQGYYQGQAQAGQGLGQGQPQVVYVQNLVVYNAPPGAGAGTQGVVSPKMFYLR